MSTRDKWGSDTPISMPSVIDTDMPVQVDFGGFAFTNNGICHNLSEAQREELFSPFFAPEGFGAPGG